MQKTRVDTILERARAQAKGTSDVIENAAKWNIKVWKFEKVVAYVRDVKAKIGLKSNSGGSQQTLRRAASVESGLNVASELRAPYIKFEETNFQFRPVFYEFKKFPTLHPENPRPGVSPFYAPDPSYAAQTEQQNLLAAVAHNRGDRKSHRDGRKRSKSTTAKPAAAAAAEASQHQPPLKKQATAPAAAAGAAAAKPVSGYCEICEQRYESLDAHLNESTHRHTIAVSSLWRKVDLCINLVNCNSEDSHPAPSTE